MFKHGYDSYEEKQVRYKRFSSNAIIICRSQCSCDDKISFLYIEVYVSESSSSSVMTQHMKSF